MSNCKIKTYKDGTRNVIYSNYDCFNRTDCKGSEEIEKSVKREVYSVPTLEDVKYISESKFRNRTDSLKRARDRVFDIAMQNDCFTHFLTITFDDKKVNSKNVREVMKKLSVWLSNRVQRYDLKYLLVPELHKSGRIHAHALVNDALDMVDSGRRLFGKKAFKVSTLKRRGLYSDDLRIIYNCASWSYGFSTAIELTGEREAVIRYICKYVTKDIDKIFGKSYWSSSNLDRDVDIEFDDVDYSEVNKQEFSSFGFSKFKYEYIRPDEVDLSNLEKLQKQRADFFNIGGD